MLIGCFLLFNKRWKGLLTYKSLYMRTGISTFRAPQLAAPLSWSSRAGKSFSFTDAFLCEHERVQKTLTFVFSPSSTYELEWRKIYDLIQTKTVILDTVNLPVYLNKQEAMKAIRKKIIINTQGHMVKGKNKEKHSSRTKLCVCPSCFPPHHCKPIPHSPQHMSESDSVEMLNPVEYLSTIAATILWHPIFRGIADSSLWKRPRPYPGRWLSFPGNLTTQWEQLDPGAGQSCNESHISLDSKYLLCNQRHKKLQHLKK